MCDCGGVVVRSHQQQRGPSLTHAIRMHRAARDDSDDNAREIERESEMQREREDDGWRMDVHVGWGWEAEPVFAFCDIGAGGHLGAETCEHFGSGAMHEYL